YAGDTVPVVIDRLTGEIRMAQIFVAVLGASSFTFAKATWTQALPDWIDAHVRAFEAIGGIPELVVPDNARTAVVKASFYDPEVNRTYAEMAAHYRTAILPARPRKPRDKAKVEQAVLSVERWLLGRLRRRTFTSLAYVDAALGELMTQLNDKQGLRRLWTASCTTRIASNSPARACAAPEANNPKLLDLRPRKGKKLSRPTSAAPRAGSSRYRGAASSRNPWAQSSRYRRAASPESARALR